jgi:hypothetical protein
MNDIEQLVLIIIVCLFVSLLDLPPINLLISPKLAHGSLMSCVSSMIYVRDRHFLNVVQYGRISFEY